MTARQGLVRFLSLGICQDVVYERGEGGPVVTRGIVPGLAGARLRRLEPILEVALRSSEVGGVEASAHDRATDGAKKVTGERSEGGVCDLWDGAHLGSPAPTFCSSFTRRARHSLSASVNLTSIFSSLF